MTSNNNNLEKALSQGYDLDFGKVIEKSFENFKKTWAMGGLAFIVIGLIFAALTAGAVIIGFGGAALSDLLNLESLENLENFKMTDLTPVLLLAYMIGVSLLAGLGNVFYAGVYHMIDDADKNKNVSLDRVFFYFRSNHFGQLLLSGIIVGVLSTLFVFVFEYLNLSFLGTLFQYVISFFTVLTVPLIVFSNQQAISAIEKSFRLIIKNFLVILGLLIVSVILSFVGLFAFCIGYIFTFIFIYIVVYYIYLSAVPTENQSDLDLIGASEE